MKRKRSKLPAPVRWLRDRVTLLVVDGLIWLLPKVQLESAIRIARLLGAFAARLPGRRNVRVKSHLAIAFPDPEWDEAFRRNLYSRSWENLAAWAVECLWSPGWRGERDDARIHIGEPEKFFGILEEARTKKRGLIIFASHLGTVELLSQWFPQAVQMPVMCTAARPKNPELEKRSRAIRESGGVKVVYRGEAGVATFRHLRSGGVLLMLVDHNLAGAGVAVPFFGKPAHTLLAPARLALQSGAVATTMYCIREAGGRYRIDCDDPLLIEPMPKDEDARFKAEARLVVEYTRRIEAAIRKNPEQYLWMHKRWEKQSDTLPLPSLD